MSQKNAEPWLRGPLEGVPPLVIPVFFTFVQVREELPEHISDLSAEQLWRTVSGTASIGFHMKHMAGSIDRLTTYVSGSQLNEQQMQFLREEHEGNMDAGTLLAMVGESLRASENILRQIDPATMYEPRSVGRKAMPTTVIGLLVHLSEHTQRHLGQTITTAKMLRDTS